jgi:hypothetical protein
MMKMKKIQFVILLAVFLLSACGRVQTHPPAALSALPADPLPTETSIPSTATPLPPTETPVPPTETLVPSPTQDPTIFGVMGINEIQGSLLESVVTAIFTKVMDGFISSGNIQEYQIISLSVFPSGNGGLLAEVIYSVRTSDSAWLADGGVQLADDWIGNNCSRFDFFTTDTEYQLKNKRLCS